MIIRLTKKDLSLINHALDILASDYGQSDSETDLEMQKQIDDLANKLASQENKQGCSE
jgi:hypothetical protein